MVPVVIGDGARLWDGVRDVAMERTEVIVSPTVTHLRFRVVQR